MGDHRAVQLINHVSEQRFKLNRDAVEKVYGDKRLAGLPLTVFCIAGAARKGKSFMLNFFLDYLTHKEKYPKQPWKLDENTCLNGFTFKEGEDRTTMGIWAWSHVFVIEKDNREKIGVSLIDSQGTFDSETSFEDCSTIFAMTCLFSSVMCFNVFGELQEDKLDNFVTFIRHGQMINDNLGGSGKLFQDLVFIVRDFNVDKFLESENGGQEYLGKVLGPNKVSQNQEKRDSINSSYERKHCFVFPHPGPTVARKTTRNIKDIDEMFVQKAKHMVETLLSSKTLRAKQLGPTIMNCHDMPDYLASCVKTFDDNKDFAPQAIQAANRHFLINLEVKRAKITYEKLMDKALDGCDKGMPKKELKDNDADITKKIEAQIKDRIRNGDICGSVLCEFDREHEQILKKYMKTNKLRLDKEAEKLKNEEKLRQQQKEYEEKLEQEKRDKEVEKLKHEEKLRQQQKEYKEKLEQEKRDKEVEKLKNEEKLRQQRKEYEEKLEQEKRRLQEQYEEERRKREAAEAAKKAAEEKARFEQFQTDAKQKVKSENPGFNKDTTFRTTSNGYHCCVFYNQGVAYTDVNLFYRRDEDSILTKCESFLFAIKAAKFEDYLLKKLGSTENIEETWEEAKRLYG